LLKKTVGVHSAAFHRSQRDRGIEGNDFGRSDAVRSGKANRMTSLAAKKRAVFL